MKYVITWEARPNVTEESTKRGLAAFSKWSPSHPEHFLAFLGRIDGNGGFAVVETEDPAEVARDTGPFTTWFEFHVYPCLEIAETATIAGEGLAFLESVS
jgi:hypothetical protein